MDNANSGRRIAGDVIAAMEDRDGNLTVENLPWLKEVLGDGGEAEDFIAKMADGDYLSQSVESFREGECNARPDALVARLKRSTRAQRLRTRIVSSAAAAVLVAGLFFVVDRLRDSEQAVFAGAEVSVPTLILGTGETVDLSGRPELTSSEYTQPSSPDIRTETEGEVPVPIFNTVVIPSRYIQKIVLPDGSSVLINANSRLRYPQHFAGDTREVWLEGEAFFSVAHSSDTQFLVHTDKQTVRVYGTEFNVNTNISGHVTTMLIKGSVGVTIAGGSEYMLEPNQSLTLDEADGSVAIETIVSNSHLKWREGYFACDMEPLSRLLSDISVWYGITFTLTDPAIGEQKATVMLDRGMDPEKLLGHLETALGIEFVKKKGGYEVR